MAKLALTPLASLGCAIHDLRAFRVRTRPTTDLIATITVTNIKRKKKNMSLLTKGVVSKHSFQDFLISEAAAPTRVLPPRSQELEGPAAVSQKNRSGVAHGDVLMHKDPL